MTNGLAFGALFLLVFPFAARAQVPTGDTLAALLPAKLAEARRGEVTTYGRFATTSYELPSGGQVILQFHEVLGAGSEAYQRSTCPRTKQVGGRAACVRADPDRVHLSWVFSDAVQVLMSAPDEATVVRLSKALPFTPLERLATEARATPAEDEGVSFVTGGSAAPAPVPVAAPSTSRPKLLSMPKPVYPTEARARGIEGSVMIQVEVAADGTPTSFTPRKGNPALSSAAIEAAKGARFEPARDAKGTPVAATTTVIVRFVIDE